MGELSVEIRITTEKHSTLRNDPHRNDAGRHRADQKGGILQNGAIDDEFRPV